LQAYLDAEQFAINVLSAEQRQLAEHFAQSDHTVFNGCRAPWPVLNAARTRRTTAATTTSLSVRLRNSVPMTRSRYCSTTAAMSGYSTNRLPGCAGFET
jgi:flavin reductase (DIM6/NTAB) family NADH-FMN oxidoreductase RutF